MESPPLSRASLIDAYVSALPFAPVAVVVIPGGCRVAVGGEPAAGETIKHQFYFRPLHIELVLGAAALSDGLIKLPADAVAARIELAAATLGAPCHTLEQLRKFAAPQVAEIVVRVKASGRRGKLKSWNSRYRIYRLERTARCEAAIDYWSFLELKVVLPTVRNIAAMGRTV
jgi:hypothetical protein